MMPPSIFSKLLIPLQKPFLLYDWSISYAVIRALEYPSTVAYAWRRSINNYSKAPETCKLVRETSKYLARIEIIC